MAHKILKTSHLRELEAQVSRGEISYSRMVEIINELILNAITENSKEWSHQCASESEYFEQTENKLKDEIDRWKKLYYSESQMNDSFAKEFGEWIITYAYCHDECQNNESLKSIDELLYIFNEKRKNK